MLCSMIAYNYVFNSGLKMEKSDKVNLLAAIFSGGTKPEQIMAR